MSSETIGIVLVIVAIAAFIIMASVKASPQRPRPTFNRGDLVTHVLRPELVMIVVGDEQCWRGGNLQASGRLYCRFQQPDGTLTEAAFEPEELRQPESNS